MESLFLKLVNMSINASWLVLAVLVLRFVLKKAPKSILCSLWAMVALRLMFPFSFKSIFSLIPSAEPLPEEFLYSATPQLNTGIGPVDQVLNPIIAENLAPIEPVSANPAQIYSFIFSQIWILGMALMLLYLLISYCVLLKKVRVCIRIDNTVRLCDHIESPFILGIIQPRIYLPSNLDPVTTGHVLAHEQAHLKRRDHWWKPLGFVLLSIYWFNPVLWLSYILLCRDIEQACDEKVVQGLDIDGKKAYSLALLRCSAPQKMITACPLAFGEVGVKKRIKSVLNYKKPAFWVVLVAVIGSIVVAVCFLTDPAAETETWEKACQEVLADFQEKDSYHITVSAQYEGEYFLNDTSFSQYYKSGDTLMKVCYIPADGSTTGYLKKNEQYYESITYDSSMVWEETDHLEEAALTPWLFYFQYDDSKVDAIARKDTGDSYYIRLKVNEPADGNMLSSSYHVDFYFDHKDNFLYAVQTVQGEFYDRPNRTHTRTMTMTVSDTQEEDIHGSLEQLVQTDYRMAVGTYAPISSETETEWDHNSLSLVQTYAYEVTEDSFIIHNLKSGDSTRYHVDWGWKGYAEADERIPLMTIHRLTQPFGILKPLFDNSALKYQYISEDYHLLSQDGAVCLAIAERMPNSDLVNWRVHSLVADHPSLLPPKSFLEALTRIGEVNAAVAFNRSGDRRPGLFDMTEKEVDALRKILSEIPEDACTPCSSIPDVYSYYIHISCRSNSSNSVGFYFHIYYDYEHISLVWYDQYAQQWEAFEITDTSLQVFLESMMQPERIDNYVILIDSDHPTYVSYTHEDITIKLVQVAGWEYEVVPYVDDHTDFGIRCKPEWLGDWLFFGYMHGELVPESTFLHEAKVDGNGLGDAWHYLFENPIDGNVSWREWPEIWKMIYCYADGGTYYIYNEGSFDECLAEHDRGGYNSIESSFAHGLWDEETVIQKSGIYINVANYENPEVSYEPATHRWYVLWHKKDSEETTTVTLDPVLYGFVE